MKRRYPLIIERCKEIYAGYLTDFTRLYDLR